MPNMSHFGDGPRFRTSYLPEAIDTSTMMPGPSNLHTPSILGQVVILFAIAANGHDA